ncbi:MAG: radical SAM protein [Prolixibacteraceae bacterium]|nr:radical SAM protein [Prolixibacteraceae bacterium]
MKIMMFETPTLERDGSVPFGVLYAASSVFREGHDVKIIDLVKNEYSYIELRNIIIDFAPDLIGMGGITSSYKNCKALVKNIKNDFRQLPIVAGGVISSVSDLLLKSVGVDYIVHGEGEKTFPELVNAIEHGKSVSEISGISFLDKERIVRTAQREQIERLDDIPMPHYELLDMEKYLEPAEKWFQRYFSQDIEAFELMGDRAKGKRFLFPIITARGCTHKCIFCYRHHKGLRQHSVPYVISMMKHLHEKYQVDVFQINDELTTGNRQWVMEFCDAIIHSDMDILMIVLSARVDTVDEEILTRLREAGCIMINYGYESGSDIMLKEIRKGVSRDQALKAGLLTKKIGIKSVPEIIIGFPSETNNTVDETIDFLKRLDTWPISVNTPIPFPETTLWKYAIEKNLISDKEDFVSNYRRGLFVNFTKYSDLKVQFFVTKVKYETLLHWLKRRKKYCEYFITYIKCIFLLYVKPVLPNRINKIIQLLYFKLSNTSV